MKDHGRNRHKDTVAEAVQAMNECPVPDQIQGLDWSLLRNWTEILHSRRNGGAVYLIKTSIQNS